MPNAAVHDAITFLLTVPAFACAYSATGDAAASAVLTSGFLFGGLMFGPDLDTISKQYSRWGRLRFIWYPYRTVFKHRSRWSHGLTFGSLLRVVYFFGWLTIIGVLVASVLYLFAGFNRFDVNTLEHAWRDAGSGFWQLLGPRIAAAGFAGCWLGAASHTITDITVSYVRTGRSSEFL